MTVKDIEQMLKQNTTEGAIVMNLTEISRAVKDSNLDRVRKKYLIGLPRLEKKYFITDVAKRIYANTNY